jgi:hypothetical protein
LSAGAGEAVRHPGRLLCGVGTQRVEAAVVLALRVEIMGSHTCRIVVGESQSLVQF